MTFTKSRFTLLLLFASLALVFVSCKKKNEDPKPNNAIVLAGTEYPIDNGFWKDLGSNDSSNTSFRIDLSFLSNSIVIDSSSGTGFKGTGNLAFLDLNTGQAGTVQPGTYSLDITQSRPAMSWSLATFLLNADASNINGDFWLAISGKVNVTQDGSNYTITWDFQVTDGALPIPAIKKLTGSFTGPLTKL